jgi:nucleotide-binding universal stress UspA family protein
MRPILLATDGSPSAAAAALEAIGLARSLETSIVAVAVSHVVVPTHAYYGYAEAVAMLQHLEDQRVAEVLHETAAAAKAAGIECETVGASGAIVEEICKVARDRNARMIIAGAHGWGPVKRMLHGSVSTGLLHAARCPILVVPRSGSTPSEPLAAPDLVATVSKEPS